VESNRGGLAGGVVLDERVLLNFFREGETGAEASQQGEWVPGDMEREATREGGCEREGTAVCQKDWDVQREDGKGWYKRTKLKIAYHVCSNCWDCYWILCCLFSKSE
jgi:hypothetical protein